jgi:hypothetical protein
MGTSEATFSRGLVVRASCGLIASPSTLGHDHPAFDRMVRPVPTQRSCNSGRGGARKTGAGVPVPPERGPRQFILPSHVSRAKVMDFGADLTRESDHTSGLVE